MYNEKNNQELLSLTTEIVSSYVSGNKLEKDELPVFISTVYSSLQSISAKNASSNLTPVVSVKDSIHDDYIVCLEDGKKLKMLKRHLKTTYGLSPDEYRKKWGLPQDYPVVAPNYAKKRSSLAKKIGLGVRKRAN